MSHSVRAHVLVAFLVPALLSCHERTPATLEDPEPSAPIDHIRAELKTYIEQVAAATGRRYQMRDNQGHSMGTLKIIESAAAGGFIAVYFTYVGGLGGHEFEGHLATSSDLVNWRWVRRLGGDVNQPTIRAAGDGYVVAWEQGPENYLKFEHYSDWPALRDGLPDHLFEAPRTLTSCSEGTPNVYAVTESSIDVGFHYHWNCDVDRQARGTITGWSEWRAVRQPALDTAILAHGIQGNVGDRDGVLTYKGRQFTIIEGQYRRGDFDSWRVFLYDHLTATADELRIRTDKGSEAFGNPTFELVEFNGRPALVVTLFVFDNRFGEGGPLVYYWVF